MSEFSKLNGYDVKDVVARQGKVNVKQFGVKGDGTTDDTTALNNAIAYCKTNGVTTLIFPDGVYVISDTLDIDFSNFELVGSTGTVIKYVGDGITGSLIKAEGVEGSPISNIHIKNIKIDCTEQVYKGGESMETPAQTSGSPAYVGLRGIFFNFVKNFTIDRVTIKDLYGDGIRVQRCHTGIVNNCYLESVGGGNIIQGGPTGWDNFGDGIVAFFSFDIKFTNNTLINKRVYLTSACAGYICGRSGLEFEYGLDTDNIDTPDNDLFSFTNGHGLVMQNNYVYGYTKGIHLEAGIGCSITDNAIIHCNIGLMNTTAGRASFSGNYFNSDNVGAAYQSGYNRYYTGIAVSSYTSYTNVMITNNVFEGDSEGVTIGRSYVTLLGNTFRNVNTNQRAVRNIETELHDLVISANQFDNNNIDLYHTTGCIISENSCKNTTTGFLTLEKCTNSVVVNNSIDNKIQLKDTCRGTLIQGNTFLTNNDTTVDYFLQDYVSHNLSIKDNLVDLTNNDTAMFANLKSEYHLCFENNTFRVNATRTEPVNKAERMEYTTIKNNSIKGNAPLLQMILCTYHLVNLTIEDNRLENPIAYVIYQSAGSISGVNSIRNNKGLFAFKNNPNSSLASLSAYMGRYVAQGEVIYKYSPSSTSLGWACTRGGYYTTTNWSSGAAYTSNALVLSNGYVYQCTTAGTSTAAPTSTTLGANETTSDGLTWLCCGQVATFVELVN